MPDAAGGIGAAIYPSTAFVRVELEIMGERLGFLLDTGASYSMISEAVWQRWHAAHSHWPTTRGAYGYAQMTGSADEGELGMIRVPEATLGDIRLSNPGFVTRPEGVFERYMSSMMTAPIVGALAGNVLRHLCLTIDYQRQRLHVRPEQTDCGQDLKALGLCLHTQGPQCFVTAVSKAAHTTTRTQVQPGDEVVAVGGYRLDGTDLTSAVEALCGVPGELLEVQVRRNATASNLQLPVVALLG
ncbi:aspartyl protease family protein [Deinococcus malanensis]